MQRVWVRAGLAAAVLVALAGCKQQVGPAYKPMAAETRAKLAKSGMDAQSPMFVRVFKEESQLEVWKVKSDGQYGLFKTYPICKWSGDLGPKERQGDKQSPEGFYTVSARQMNPKSNYYLAFNVGFPNAYDKAYGRTGQHIMVHGDCKSVGCFAMTDAQMEEIYILAREAFKGGQESFQVQALPFRMTKANMEKHKDSKWYGFWKDLKTGYDAFEAVHAPPRIDVCNRKYMVNASFVAGRDDLDPAGPCPSNRGIINATPPADQQQMASNAPTRPTFGVARPTLVPASFTKPTAIAEAAPAEQTAAKPAAAPQSNQQRALGSVMGLSFGARKPNFNGFLLAPSDATP